MKISVALLDFLNKRELLCSLMATIRNEDTNILIKERSN